MANHNGFMIELSIVKVFEHGSWQIFNIENQLVAASLENWTQKPRGAWKVGWGYIQPFAPMAVWSLVTSRPR